MTAFHETPRMSGETEQNAAGANPQKDGFYDDNGRWWPDDAEWCDRCQGLGIAECYCGGDQCYCENYGEMECPQCDGEGMFVPTAAFKAAREQNAKWWREYQEKLAATIPSPLQGG